MEQEKKGQKLKDTPSHMSLAFGKRFMLEAVGGAGVRFNFLPTFLKENDIVGVFEYLRGDEIDLKEGRLLTEGALKYHGMRYDKLGVLWFGIFIFRKWLLGTPLPPKNDWDSGNRFFCSELMEFIDSRDAGTSDPNSQMKMLEDNKVDYKKIFSSENGQSWSDFWQPHLDDMKTKSTRKPKK